MFLTSFLLGGLQAQRSHHFQLLVFPIPLLTQPLEAPGTLLQEMSEKPL